MKFGKLIRLSASSFPTYTRQSINPPKMPPKRKALEELSSNTSNITQFFSKFEKNTSEAPNQSEPRPPIAGTATPTTSASTPTRINVGGASKLTWFNKLAIDPSLAPAKANLERKIAHTRNDNGCTVVVGFTAETRPVLDKDFLEVFREICGEAPARYAPYHIAMLQANKLVPEGEPCSYPEGLRLVKHKRVKTAAPGNEKAATWVASHLCHNNKCININHLTWEPSWFNRLRDNCPGGEACVHRPHACLQPHRPADRELIDWTQYM